MARIKTRPAAEQLFAQRARPVGGLVSAAALEFGHEQRWPSLRTKAHIMSNHDDFTLQLLNLFSPSRLDGDWADDLRSAVAAIEAVLAGTAPDGHALASAPLLSEWTPGIWRLLPASPLRTMARYRVDNSLVDHEG